MQMQPAYAGIGSLAYPQGMDQDSMLVQMTPREVGGLQALARAHGATEEDLYDPVTGQPRFGFLKNILPMIAGAVLGPGGIGGGLFKTSLGAATAVGLGYGLIEGDLKKGLMAGLGAYSGANIATGLRDAANISTAPTAQPGQVTEAPTPSLVRLPAGTPQGGISPTQSVTQVSDAINRQQILGGAAPSVFQGMPKTVTQAPPLPAPAAPQTSGIGTYLQGAQNALTTKQGGEAFMNAMGSGLGRYANLMGFMGAFAEEPKGVKVPGADEEIVYVPGAFNPLYGTGADQPRQLPGKYYRRTASGMVPLDPTKKFAMGGEIQQADRLQPRMLPDQSHIMPYPNTSYPLANTMHSNYSPINTSNPQGREVVYGYENKIDPFTGEEKFAEGGETTTGTPATPPPVNPFVAEGDEYVKRLNQRALNPEFNPYGMTSGIGGASAPYTGGTPYGDWQGGTDTGGATGGGAGDVAGFLATQVGINWMMQPGNAAALKDWIANGMVWKDRPFLNPAKAAPPAGGTAPATGGTAPATGGTAPATGGTAPATGGTAPAGTAPAGTAPAGTAPAGGAGAGAGAATPYYLKGASGVEAAGLQGLTPEQLAQLPTGAGIDTLMKAGFDSGALTPGLSALTPQQLVQLPENELMKMGLDPKVVQSIKADSLAGKVVPGAQTALGLYTMYKGIEQGKAGQAALGGYGAGAGIASLTGAGSGLAPILGMNPIGLGLAALAAIGSTFVKKGEMGEIPLRNYWRAVDQGRGYGSAPPAELAEGFINFYRTSKNNFPGLEKYGKKGNEDFVYDMTQVINDAVKEGKIKEGATADEVFQSTVKPWLDSMGSGPSHPDAKRVQDFMMTDLIHNFMMGKPISNAQVKGDSNYKIVSQKPVYAGTVPESMKTPAAPADTTGAGIPEAQNPFGYGEMQFADGGAIGENYNFGFAAGGAPGEYKAGGRLLNGPGDGMSDSIPAVIRGRQTQRAALADGEFVIPADVVSHLGNGSTKAGAKKLYTMMNQVRRARTGRSRQAPAVRAERFMPA